MQTISNHMPTAELQELDAAHHMHPFTAGGELAAKGARIITRAKGSCIYDSEGAEILDAMAGLWCMNIGYGREEMRSKLEQAGLEADVIDYTYGPFGRLAWRLTIKWPMVWLNTSFLSVVVLPFWYALVLLPSLVLNALDVSSKNRTGTGLIVVAHRP